MGASSRYCNLWRINPAGNHIGYERYFVPLAQAYYQNQGLSEAEEVAGDRFQQGRQIALLSRFQLLTADPTERAHAGLCLRCYVSEPILNACRKIAHLFGDDQSFTYRDLLPFVLNDDGKTLIVSDPDGKTSFTLDHTGTPQTTAYIKSG